jgi:hypothetical protein
MFHTLRHFPTVNFATVFFAVILSLPVAAIAFPVEFEHLLFSLGATGITNESLKLFGYFTINGVLVVW